MREVSEYLMDANLGQLTSSHWKRVRHATNRCKRWRRGQGTASSKPAELKMSPRTQFSGITFVPLGSPFNFTDTSAFFLTTPTSSLWNWVLGVGQSETFCHLFLPFFAPLHWILGVGIPIVHISSFPAAYSKLSNFIRYQKCGKQPYFSHNHLPFKQNWLSHKCQIWETCDVLIVGCVLQYLLDNIKILHLLWLLVFCSAEQTLYLASLISVFVGWIVREHLTYSPLLWILSTSATVSNSVSNTWPIHPCSPFCATFCQQMLPAVRIRWWGWWFLGLCPKPVTPPLTVL